jgi:glycosidase
MVLKRGVLLLVAALGLAGCLTRAALPKAKVRTPVAVALVTDEAHGTGTGPSPRELETAVVAALNERNLEAHVVPFDQLAHAFGDAHDTRRRFEVLAHQREEPLALLVETQASFVALTAGRYRWSVEAKMTAGKKEAPADALSHTGSFPAVLQLEGQKEPEAISTVSDVVAQRAAQAFDAFIALTEKASRAQIADREVSGFDAMYFVLVDRFADGDPTNDLGVDKADPAGWHGGDLQGVIDHLDDLQKLGVRTIWLSPVYKTRAEKFFGHGAFHGYWVQDLREVDPRFGTIATLRKLSDELHKRHMRLYLDLVLNHVGPEAPLAAQHPDWFHHEGELKDWNDPEQLTNHDVMGLPDFAQEKPEVYRYLFDASMRWVAMANPDGFRLDAVKHIPLGFWQRFNKEVRERAGKDFGLLGEDLDGDPKGLSKTAREGDFSAVFDFPLHYALVDVFCKDQSPVKLGTVLTADRLYPDADQLVTVLDNHDLPRILTDCGGHEDKVEQALLFQMTARGVPALTYGTESGLLGEHEPENRGDMRFDDGFPLKARIAQLLALRRSHPSLVHGASQVIDAGANRFAYARVAPGEAALIAVNHGDAYEHLSLPEGIPAVAKIVDLLSGIEVAPGELKVWPHATRVFLLTPKEENGFGAWASAAKAQWLTPTQTREVVFSAGEDATLVGSGEPFGGWDPMHGHALAGGKASMQLPVGAIYEYKLVRKTGPSTTWEDGSNRILWVAPGNGPIQVALAWNQK